MSEPSAMHGSTLRALAGAFDMSALALVEKWRDTQVQQMTGQHRIGSAARAGVAPPVGIPIVNRPPAGEAVDYADVGIDGYDRLPIFAEAVGDPDAFAVEVVGDSMLPEFSERDLVICSPKLRVENGDVAYVRTHEGCTLKRVYQIDGGRLELRPDNLRHRPQVVPEGDVIQCHKVVGKYVRY